MAKSLLEAMCRNPVGDWRIEDIERECARYKLRIEPPRGGGSHWKIWSDRAGRSLIVPARRPLKPIYVKLFVAFLDDYGEKA